jgi:acetyltransferase-like isoleucine patch superfamily enzyme
MLKILTYILNKIKLEGFKKKWRKLNPHNSTIPKNIFNINNVKVGNKTYGTIEVLSWNDRNEGLIIGNFCSIAKDVKFLLGGNHNYNNISTFPFKYIYKGILTQGVSKGEISIKDDVWIGYGSTILSGVTIGQGAIIGAMSVIAKDIPPYAIAVGNPARVIRFRFGEEVIQRLLSSDLYSKIDDSFIKEHIDYFNIESNIRNIESLLNEIAKQKY